MPSPKRDQYNAGAGKLLKNDDTVLDVTAILVKLDAVLSAVTGLKVDATIETGDIEIGGVELKDAATDQRASIEPVNTARTVATVGVATQPIDEAGNVLGKTAANTARTAATKVQPSQIVDAAGNVVGVTAANTARVATDKVLLVQNIDAAGNVGSGGYAEDSAHVSGDKGTMGLAVRNDTGAALSSADGDYTPTTTDAVNNLRVTQGTTSYSEDYVFNVNRVQSQGTYTVPLTASALVKSGAGQLFGFVVNSCAAGATLKIWDNTSAATTVMFDTMTFTTAVAEGPRVVMLPAAVKFNTGCYFTIAVAAMSVTPIWN